MAIVSTCFSAAPPPLCTAVIGPTQATVATKLRSALLERKVFTSYSSGYPGWTFSWRLERTERDFFVLSVPFHHCVSCSLNRVFCTRLPLHVMPRWIPAMSEEDLLLTSPTGQGSAAPWGVCLGFYSWPSAWELLFGSVKLLVCWSNIVFISFPTMWTISLSPLLSGKSPHVAMLVLPF